MSKSSRSFKDQDYWHKLTPQQRAWLKRFNSEYYDGRGVTLKPKKGQLHRDPEQIKTINRDKKKRDRDVFNTITMGHTYDSIIEGLRENEVLIEAINNDTSYIDTQIADLLEKHDLRTVFYKLLEPLTNKAITTQQTEIIKSVIAASIITARVIATKRSLVKRIRRNINKVKNAK